MDYIRSKGGKTDMTKNEYLAALNQALANYSPSFKKDILDAFEAHFQEGISEGRSEEEIMNDLGTIDDVLENIHMMGGEKETVHKEQKSKDYQDLKEGLSTAFHAFTRIADEALGHAKNFTVNMDRKKNTVQYYSDPQTETLPDSIAHLVIHSETLMSSLDISLEKGNELRYEFTQSQSIFRNPTTDGIHCEINDTTATILVSGSGDLTVQIPSSVSTITMEAPAGDVDINDIKLDEFNCHNKSGDVSISRVEMKRADFTMLAGDLDISDSNFDEISMKLSAGDVDLTNTTGNLYANIAAGDIDIQKHAANVIQLSAAAGDIDMEVSSPIIEVKTTAGDIDLDVHGEIQNIQVTSTAGDIDMTTETTDYRASLSTNFGDIDFDDDLPYQKLRHKKYIVGDGKGEIVIKTNAGDIDFH